MNKSKIVLFLFTFLLGSLVSGSVTVLLATKAITKIQQGDKCCVILKANMLPEMRSYCSTVLTFITNE